jgi:hypothetical protein
MNGARTRALRALGPAFAAALGLSTIGAAAPPAAVASETLTVCRARCGFTALAPALAAAHDGDRISVGPGRFAGGVTIARSISLVGAGAGRTVIVGTGDTSVVTIGTAGAATEPVVAVSGVTVTGGRVRTGPESRAFVDAPGVVAEGGGIEVPFGAQFSRGATVSLTDVIVSGNRVAPRASAAVGPPCPDGHPCPFAEAAGGGINSWGDLTLNRVVVRDNRVGSASGLSDLASDANAGGIMSRVGTLTIRRSQITHNTAAAVAPNGRFADSGGVFVESGAVHLMGDTVSGNRAMLSAALPSNVELVALAGGMHVGPNASGDVSNVRMTGNSAQTTNTIGDAAAASGGLHADARIATSRLTETDNLVSGATVDASTGSATVDSGGGELSGTITDSRISDNRVLARSVAGDASAYAGATFLDGRAKRTTFSGNSVHASAKRGTAHAGGGGVAAAGATDLDRSSVSNNRAIADGSAGWARGGGVFAMLVPEGPPGGPLRIAGSMVTGNTAAGTVARGGGVFATADHPLSLIRTVVAKNRPDDVVEVPRP